LNFPLLQRFYYNQESFGGIKQEMLWLLKSTDKR